MMALVKTQHTLKLKVFLNQKVSQKEKFIFPNEVAENKVISKIVENYFRKKIQNYFSKIIKLFKIFKIGTKEF